MAENNSSRVGQLIRNFRMAATLTQKQLAERCGLNESTIRNYELGNRYPDEETLYKIANALNISFYALADPNISNVYGALHALFDIEWAYGLRPTMKDGKLKFIMDERLEATGPRPEKDLLAFRTMLENWAKLRDTLEDGNLLESEYWMKEITFPTGNTDKNDDYDVDIIGNKAIAFEYDEDAVIENPIEGHEREEALLAQLFPEQQSKKRKRKPKKE
ncbi:MAG: helix-turn-helix protein [Firmicutes bacterium ADurb.Bin419]|nr:MAG: helix-turn-helix protein [Firmicutes bacterium ADurb.Bin419]